MTVARTRSSTSESGPCLVRSRASGNTYDDRVTSVLGAQLRAPVERALSDRCPGLLRPHQAEDGSLVRLRLPGGQTSGVTLLELSRIAAEFGEGSVQLTSRGNLQLRGIDRTRFGELVEQVAATGLLPSVSHERVRNIVASPLTGLTAERPDLRPLVTALDTALCSTPELAELPGRFLFAVDDGRGDVASLAFDLGYVALDGAHGLVLVGGRTRGFAVTRAEAVEVMIGLAQRFLALRTTTVPAAWHVSELSDLRGLDPRVEPLTTPLPDSRATPLGALGDAASVGVPLSLLDGDQVQAISRAAGGGVVVITPWRGVVIPGAAGAVPELAEAGLITDDASVWSQLTACIGAPGCAKSAISTRDLATELATRLPVTPQLPVHVSGCERRCGRPSVHHVDLMTPRSYEEARAEIGRAAHSETRRNP